jgi:hypothetical protein
MRGWVLYFGFGFRCHLLSGDVILGCFGTVSALLIFMTYLHYGIGLDDGTKLAITTTNTTTMITRLPDSTSEDACFQGLGSGNITRLRELCSALSGRHLRSDTRELQWGFDTQATSHVYVRLLVETVLWEPCERVLSLMITRVWMGNISRVCVPFWSCLV